MPFSFKFDASRPATIRRVRTAIREDRDIDPDDYRVADWYIGRQMNVFHSVAFTLLFCPLAVAFGLAAGLDTHNQMWARAFWLTCALSGLILIPTNIIHRLRTARWIARHELTEII